jgi:hypothetical protein
MKKTKQTSSLQLFLQLRENEASLGQTNMGMSAPEDGDVMQADADVPLTRASCEHVIWCASYTVAPQNFQTLLPYFQGEEIHQTWVRIPQSDTKRVNNYRC